MEKLSAAVVRRVLRFFDDESRKDPEKYAKFFRNYAYYIKAGLLEDQQLTNGRHKDQIVRAGSLPSDTWRCAECAREKRSQTQRHSHQVQF